MLDRFTSDLGNRLIDPSGVIGFPLNVLAFLPYQMNVFDNPTELAITSARRFADVPT